MKKILYVLVLVSLVLTACASKVVQTKPTRDPAIKILMTQNAQMATQIASLAEAEVPEVESTPIQQVVQPAQPAVPVIVSEWTPYESEGGVPFNGTTWSADVAPDELEVLTSGPACIAGVCLSGGTERGSVIILLPGSEVIHYDVTGVIAGSNWHGSYRPITSPTAESTWRSLAKDRVKAMKIAPNCTSGKGCKVIDVLIVGPSGIIAQWTIGQ